MNEYYVYGYRVIETQNVFYIGMGKGRRAKSTWKTARNKYFFEIYDENKCELFYVSKNLSKEEAEQLETQMVQYYKSLGQCYANSTWNGKATGVYGVRNGNYKNGEKLKETYRLHPELKDKTKHVGSDNGRACRIQASYGEDVYIFNTVTEASEWLISEGISHGTLNTVRSAIAFKIRQNKPYCNVWFKYL